MILLVDIGNARIKWGLLENERLGPTQSERYDRELSSVLDTLVTKLPGVLNGAVIANVAGESVAAEISEFLSSRFNLRPRFVRSAAQEHGLRSAYAEPERLGVDRWVAMIAAKSKLDHAALTLPFCVVDAGTAVTFDAVAADGQHLGGLIMPGPRLIAAALDAGTSGIGKTAARQRRLEGLELLGKSTSAAVGNASWLALGAAVDRAAGVVADKLGVAPRVYLTGGDAPALRNWMESEVTYEPDLVLEGLAIIARE